MSARPTCLLLAALPSISINVTCSAAQMWRGVAICSKGSASGAGCHSCHFIASGAIELHSYRHQAHTDHRNKPSRLKLQSAISARAVKSVKSCYEHSTPSDTVSTTFQNFSCERGELLAAVLSGKLTAAQALLLPSDAHAHGCHELS